VDRKEIALLLNTKNKTKRIFFCYICR